MEFYWELPTETASVLSADGWMKLDIFGYSVVPKMLSKVVVKTFTLQR
jgi:hypothetical protein